MSDLPPLPEQPSPSPFGGSPMPPPPPIGPPPGYVAYGAGNQGGFSSFQSIRGVSRALGVLMMITVAVQVLSLAVSLLLRGKVKDFLQDRISESDLNGSLGVLGGVALLTGAVMVATVVLTMIWMFRMAKNQQSMGRMGTWAPGWAIGGWFLPPCILYVIPYLMMRDLWKSSDPDSGPDWKKNPIAPIVHAWWLLFGIIPLLFVSVTIGDSNFRLGSRTVDDAARSLDKNFTVSTAQSVVQIGAAVAYLLLVRQLSARHMRTTNES